MDLTFANQSSFVYGDTTQNEATPSNMGMPTAQFGSYQGIVAAFSSGLLPGRFKAVIYDNERWASTPLVEQQDPAYYEQQTAQLLHAHGLIYIASPAPDLMWAVGRPADSYKAFLTANMAASAARYADIYDIQAQQQEENLPYFTWFVKAAAAQAKDANARVKVFVGIRTDPGGPALLAAYEATSDIADGYWLNVNGEPGPADELINAIDQPSSNPLPGTPPPAPSPLPSANPAPTLSTPGSSPTSSPSGGQSPSYAQVNESYLTNGSAAAIATANRRPVNPVSQSFVRSANIPNFAAGAAFILPVLALVFGIWRGIDTARRGRK
jgi:hypothetical protein